MAEETVQTKSDEDAAGLLSVTELVTMFEEAEEATVTARKESERDRDYVDNKQLTDEELTTLRKRGQPPVIDNRIKSKIDYLVGLEKVQRVKPKALPRTPVHEADADGAGQAMRYVTDDEDYAKKRSALWRNLLVEGAGGIAVSVEPSRYVSRVTMGEPGAQPAQQWDIKIRRIAWDRMFFDPHSSEADFSDANYLGVVLWMDYADVIAKYGEAGKEAAELTLQSTSYSDTYDDKPKYALWADKARKRVRIVQMWVRRDERWHFAEFTKGGILKAGPSPYVTDTGESDCELIFQSAYVNRDNERYGLVREMISLQDGVNKRHSKALHLLNTAQIVTEEGAVDDIERTRKEAARPDGVIMVNQGFADRFKFETRTDLAEGQFRLLQTMQNAIDLKGPNATMQGDRTGGSASGKAIIASQQGGMMEISDLMDGLRDVDRRVFRAIWNRIRQFWDAEKWVRVTDDESNVKWVGINVDRDRLAAAMAQNPEMAQKIAGAVGNVAELDCDIIIDEAPDGLTPQLEQFEALAALKQYDAKGELPFRAIVMAAPNLKDKAKILELMDKSAGPPDEAAAQMAQFMQQLQARGAEANVAKVEGDALLKRAQAEKTMREAMAPPDLPAPVQPEPFDPLAHEQAIADLENTEADTLAKLAGIERTRAQTAETRARAALAPAQFAQKVVSDGARAQQMAQRQPPFRAA